MNLTVTRRMTALGVVFASTLMAACSLRCTNPSSETLTVETLTVYKDAPILNLFDHGPPGNSPGDVYHFFAPLRSSPGGPVRGAVLGSKKLFKVATDAKPNAEKRATLLFFTFGNAQDQIIALGVHDYSPTAAEFDAGKSVVRAVLGATGNYMGARGQLTSTRMRTVRISRYLRCLSDQDRKRAALARHPVAIWIGTSRFVSDWRKSIRHLIGVECSRTAT
jgi:hypothetical protein